VRFGGGVRVSVTVRIGAPVGRVWRALTVPAEVERWAGVTAIDVPDSYPASGDYARWWDRGVVLHDYIVDLEPECLLVSRLLRGPHLVVERYDLRPAGRAATLFQASWRGHPLLADNTDSVHLLRRWCETGR
jgi:hypothetical protein